MTDETTAAHQAGYREASAPTPLGPAQAPQLPDVPGDPGAGGAVEPVWGAAAVPAALLAVAGLAIGAVVIMMRARR